MAAVEYLSLRDCDRLLVELQDDSNDRLLVKTDADVYPHWHVVNNFGSESDAGKQAVWLQCMELLVAKRAPTDRLDMSLTGVFMCFAWHRSPELMDRAAQMYFDNGYMKLDRRLPGRLRAETDHIFVLDGLMPLAAAITLDHAEALAFLLRNGASLELGPVIKGGGDKDAGAYARERGAVRSIAALNAHAMRCSIAGGANSPEAAPAPSLPRRPRIGV